MASAQFIPVIFPNHSDLASGPDTAPFGHAGFILVDALGNAKYYEFGLYQNGENDRLTFNDSGGLGNLRGISLPPITFNSDGQINTASLETALNALTAGPQPLYPSDPLSMNGSTGMLFLSPFAITNAQYQSMSDAVQNYKSKPTTLGQYNATNLFDPNDCLSFVYKIAAAGNLNIGVNARDPTVSPISLLAANPNGFEYFGPDSWNGNAIYPVDGISSSIEPYYNNFQDEDANLNYAATVKADFQALSKLAGATILNIAYSSLENFFSLQGWVLTSAHKLESGAVQTVYRLMSDAEQLTEDAVSGAGNIINITLNSASGVLQSTVQFFTSGAEALLGYDSSGTLSSIAVANAGSLVSNQGTLSDVITGFGPGVTLDILGIGTATGVKLGANNVISMQGVQGSISMNLDPAMDYSHDNFVATSDGNGGTDITAVPTATVIDLGSLGGGDPVATDINSSGQIVGYSGANGPNLVDPFLYQDGSMSDLGALPDTGGSSEANAINESGEIVGYSNVIQSIAGGFSTVEDNACLWQKGSVIALGTFPGVSGGDSVASAINSAGEAVGYSTALIPRGLIGVENAFLWQDGAMSDLGTLGAGNVPSEGFVSAATGINSSGEVVGYSTVNVEGRIEQPTHAFLYQSGTMSDLGTLAGGFGTSYANAINDEGQIVGYSFPSTDASVFARPQAVLWQNGTITNLGAWGSSTSSEANAINNAGQIVGVALFTYAAQNHATLWQHDMMIDLNSLLPFNSTWELLDATGINDAGQIVGTGLDLGTAASFELTLPSDFALCFLRGTLIRTPAGELSIERLSSGDEVLTLGGRARRIVWIGEGRVLATRGRRNAATPVIVRKGALADNVPNRDLHVTKGHALYIDDALIPVEFLVNDRSILWDDHAQEVRLYHIELETHDVLLANGASAESYRDDGNRWLFQNANSGWHLPPQEPCAPVLTGGKLVDAVWRRLLERAGPRPGVPTTNDPDLHLLADSRRVDASSSSGMLHIFRLAARPTTVRVLSRAAVPAGLGLARDPRCLGVALRQIMVSQGIRLRTIEAEDPRLTEGFHGFEADNGIRWTDGDAAVPADLFDGFTGPLEIALRLGGRTSYVDTGIAQRAA